jgi:hypothetical protein
MVHFGKEFSYILKQITGGCVTPHESNKQIYKIATLERLTGGCEV